MKKFGKKTFETKYLEGCKLLATKYYQVTYAATFSKEIFRKNTSALWKVRKRCTILF